MAKYEVQVDLDLSDVDRAVRGTVASVRSALDELARGPLSGTSFAETLAGIELSAGSYREHLQRSGVDPTFLADYNRRLRLAFASFEGAVGNMATRLKSTGLTYLNSLGDIDTRARSAADLFDPRGRRGGLVAQADVAKDRLNAQRAEEDAIEKLVRQTKERIDVNERILANEGDILTLRAQEARRQAEVNAAVGKQARLSWSEINALPPDQRGSFFQRSMAYLHGRQTGQVTLPTAQPRLGQYVAQGAFNTLRYAFSGGLVYGAVRGITELIREAEELERIMNQVRAQFESLNETGQFEGFREAIFDIARETGVAANDVAFVAFQFKGAFKDTTQAAQETASAMKLVQVTGLELAEVTDSLTAISRSYGTTVDEIGDKALGLQERFGVLANQTITFTADLAAVADEAGLSFEQTAALGAAAQQVSGRSGAALAEGFNRILPAMSEASVQIVALYQSMPNLASGLDEVARAAGRGESGKILLRLIEDWKNLNSAQRDNIITTLGGRREAQALIPVLENADLVLNELNGDINDSGTLTSYFADLQRTLAQQTARLREEFRLLGEALFRAGLGDILQDAAVAGRALLSVLRPVIELMAELNEATGGNALRFLEVVAALRLASFAFGRAAVAVNRYRAAAAGAATAEVAAASVGVGTRLIGGLATVIPGSLRGARQAYVDTRAAQQAAPTWGSTRSPGRISAGASGLAAIVDPRALLLASFIATTAAYLQQRSRVQDQVADLERRMQTFSRERLEQLASDHEDIWGRLQNAVLGAPDIDELARRTLARPEGPGGGNEGTRVVLERIRALAQVYGHDPELEAARRRADYSRQGLLADLTGGVDPTFSSFEELIEAIERGDKQAIGVASQLLVNLTRDDTWRPRLQASLELYRDNRRREAKEARQKARTPESRIASGASQFNVEETERLFEAGDRTLGQLLAAYQYEIRAYERILATGNITPAQERTLADLRRKVAKNRDEALVAELETLNTIAQFTGGTPEQELRRTLDALAAARRPETRQKLANDVLALEQAVLQSRIDTAASAEEAAQIGRRGLVLPPEVQSVILEAMGSVNVVWQEYMTSFSGLFVTLGVTGTDIAIRAVEIGTSLSQAAASVLRERRAELERQRDIALGEATGQERNQLVSGFTAALQAADDAINQALGLAGTPVAPGARVTAEQEAQRALDDRAAAATRAYEEALLEVDAARAEGDPVALARIALRQADLAQKHAQDTGDRAAQQRAIAQRIRADRSLEDALLAEGNARLELSIAIAEAAGRTVEAAAIRTRMAQDALNAAIARYGPDNDAVLAPLRTALVQSRASERDTQLQEIMRRVDTDLQLERISTSQAISTLLSIPNLIMDLTQEQRDEIALKVKQLRDQSQQNLGLEGIRLPTTYEVRRLATAQDLGLSYQDLRNIEVTMYITNGMDEARAAQFLSDAMSRPVRLLGTRERAY